MANIKRTIASSSKYILLFYLLVLKNLSNFGIMNLLLFSFCLSSKRR
nr:MAG TPA: hypothetical protein [Caudoviricetes sp.]